MMAWWYRPKHVVTLNKINIHNTSCVLTCESLLLICRHYEYSDAHLSLVGDAV
jgi:hypothetical protein